MAQILWSELAKEHLREIDAYIAEGSPFYSIIFIDRLIAAVEKVGMFPKCGRIVPEFGIESLREIIFHEYRIVYQLANDKITIVAIVHGAMDIIKRRDRETWDLT
ncbi:MAG: type II toxin-antitoxin system RelE/ParE family toxin [Nitrospirae bacterium]|nr:MAG: type II toxin-antitoxin system RelE/ParE family toxin [Nitrospirota bacterium]